MTKVPLLTLARWHAKSKPSRAAALRELKRNGYGKKSLQLYDHYLKTLAQEEQPP